MNPLSQIGRSIQDLYNGAMGTSYYNAPAPATTSPSLPNVPTQYMGALRQAAAHTNIPIAQLAAHISAENGNDWNPTKRGPTNDYGITQLTPAAISQITGQGGKSNNYFKQNYGQDFDIKNPTHQILGMGVYLNWLRQSGLPEKGYQNPTNAQVMTGYNTMKLGSPQGVKYLAFLQSRGALPADAATTPRTVANLQKP